MKKTLKNNSALFLRMLLFMVLLASTVATVAISHDADNNLRGETFTDPSKQFPMPGDWIDKSIVYEREAERVDADLSIVMDQDIYYTLLPIIRKFGKDNNLKIFVKEGTCGIAAGMLGKNPWTWAGSAACRAPKTVCRVCVSHDGHRGHSFLCSSGQSGGHCFLVTAPRYIPRQVVPLVRDQNVARHSGPGLDDQRHRQASLSAAARPLAPGVRFRHGVQPRLHEVGSIPDDRQVASSRNAIGWEVLT
jgi:hypothetical protein